jgi:Cu-Zn family superoxide dismutase
MKFAHLLAAAALVAVPAMAAPTAPATIVDGTGKVIGGATLVGDQTRLSLKIDIDGLTPGVHGMHFHEHGVCEGPKFTSAGGHLNPAMHQHGTLNPMGSHLGDLPNITADAAGSVHSIIPLPMKLGALEKDAAMGLAIVIHAGPDDYKTDPSGNSGDRVACGVFKFS